MKWDQAYESRYLRVDPAKQRFEVNRRTFTDPAVFKDEKERLLTRSWIYLGHDSEIRQPNDYITRKILDFNLIFTRDRAGEVRAFFNSCPHRGATICRDAAGSRKSFSCPYHGWTFSNAGKLLDRSAAYGYPEGFCADGAHDLLPVPKMASRRGFWFVNFDAAAVPLDDYLGAAADRIDMIADHSAAGLEVINGCHEYAIRANYKLMCENSYDGYHLYVTHASYVDYMKEVTKGLSWDGATNRSRALTNGHACFEMDIPAGRPIAQWLPFWGEEAKAQIEAKRAEVYERLGEERGNFVTKWHRNMIIFPATVMNDQQSILIRSLLPVSHNETIVRAWALGPVDETPLLRKIRLENVLSFLGPGGFATPDDVEMLESCQSSYESSLQQWNDVSKGFAVGEDSETGIDKYDNELQMRAYWTEYDRRMSERAHLDSDRGGQEVSPIDDRLRTRLQVEDFLFREAELLDQWQLDDWLALYTKDCRYEVGPTGKADAQQLSPATSLFLIADDRFRLEQRVIRMKKPSAHAEYPRSRTRHLYSNVSVLADDADSLRVGFNFVTFRTNKGFTQQYLGRIRMTLVDAPGSADEAGERPFQVQAKQITLDLDNLVPQGKVTIFL